MSLWRQDETGNKLDGRGDSAVSKGTTDSGVVMESAQIPALPGQVPRQLPPLTCAGESELVGPKPWSSAAFERNVINSLCLPDVRPKSSEILEELLSQGIIPVGQRCSAAGEAYSIVVGHQTQLPSSFKSYWIKRIKRCIKRFNFPFQFRAASLHKHISKAATAKT